MVTFYNYTDLEGHKFTLDFYEIGVRREHPIPDVMDLDALCNGRMVWIESISGEDYPIPSETFKDMRQLVFKFKANSERGKAYAS